VGLAIYVLAHGGDWWPESWFLWFLLLQWLLIIPHELGHATAAEILGFERIRIIVGYGKPILTTRFMGHQWLINVLPFGGLTLAEFPNGKPDRCKDFLLTVAGPAVNLIILLGLILALGGNPNSHGVLGIVFWANLLVLVGNLIPFTFESSLGSFPNDGLHLYNTLHRT